MKFAAVFTATLASLSSVASAASQLATVNNNCPFTVFLQSFPYDGSTPGPFTVLKPGSALPYSELYRDGGSTIKLSNKRGLDNPLFFAYTNQDTLYYSLDDQYGNPFLAYRNKLIPSSASCNRFNCAPNNSGCYSFAGSKVYGCAKPVNVTATLCA